LLDMTDARRHVAARYVLAALSLSWWLPATPAHAEGGPQLILPLVAAITAAQMAGSLPRSDARGGPLRYSGRIPFLPEQLQIPDAYADAEQDFIDLDRSEPPIDGDRYVWVDLLPRKQRGWMASLAYDQESRGPLADDDDLLSIVLEHRF
jgi:hypothetical protein